MHVAARPPRFAPFVEGATRDKPSNPRATCMPALTCLACDTGATVAPRLLQACEVQPCCSSQPAPRWPHQEAASARVGGSPGPRRPSPRRTPKPPYCHQAPRHGAHQQLAVLLLLLSPSWQKGNSGAALRSAAGANSAAAAGALALSTESSSVLAALEEHEPHSHPAKKALKERKKCARRRCRRHARDRSRPRADTPGGYPARLAGQAAGRRAYHGRQQRSR